MTSPQPRLSTTPRPIKRSTYLRAAVVQRCVSARWAFVSEVRQLDENDPGYAQHYAAAFDRYAQTLIDAGMEHLVRDLRQARTGSAPAGKKLR